MATVGRGAGITSYAQLIEVTDHLVGLSITTPAPATR